MTVHLNLVIKVVEKTVEVGILFDFYGKLLSDRQYTAIELYYIHDLSLAEIGGELDISRQGVYDTLKRAEHKLYEYEDVLGLVNKFYYNNKEIKKISELAAKIEKESEVENNQEIYGKAKDIQSIISKIIDND